MKIIMLLCIYDLLIKATEQEPRRFVCALCRSPRRRTSSGEQGGGLSEPSEHSAGQFAPASEAETERRRADESSFRNGQGREHSSLPWSGHGIAGRSHESAHRSLPVREARAQGPEAEGKSKKRASAIRPRPRAASSAKSLRRRTSREEQGQSN